jgi:hypothetical protein
LPYYAFLPLKKCVTACPNPYFNNVVNHQCTLCPSVCTSCLTAQLCTNCISNHYNQNGQCVASCTGGYYADSTGTKCVISVLCRPYYGDNTTLTCIPSCPTATFPNNDSFRCDACY